MMSLDEVSTNHPETFMRSIHFVRSLAMALDARGYQRGLPPHDSTKVTYDYFKANRKASSAILRQAETLDHPPTELEESYMDESDEEIASSYAAIQAVNERVSYTRRDSGPGGSPHWYRELEKGCEVEDALPKFGQAARALRRELTGMPIISPLELGDVVEMACRASYHDLPEVYNIPRRFPENLPGQEEVNTVLFVSLLFQKSDPLNSGMGCIMSSDSLTVNGLLHFYLKSLGIDSELHHGTVRVEGCGIPMAWLTVQGELIDNSYHYWPGIKGGVFIPDLIGLKKEEFYYEEDPAETTVPLMTELGNHTCVTDPRLFKAYANPENIQKFLFFRSEYPGVFPNLQLYICGIGYYCEEEGGLCDILKSRLGYLDSHKEREKMTLHCWTCGAKPKNLQQCIGCKVAKYCHAQCQAADWPIHKLLHKDVKLNTAFQKQKKGE